MKNIGKNLYEIEPIYMPYKIGVAPMYQGVTLCKKKSTNIVSIVKTLYLCNVILHYIATSSI